MNKEKDILMICKNHYNKKYKSTIDALRAYQSKYTGCNEEYITDKDILEFVLDSASKFFNKIDWINLIRNDLVQDIDFASYGISPYLIKNDSSITSSNTIELTYRYLITKISIVLCLLNVKENGKWIIDLSEYNGITEII